MKTPQDYLDLCEISTKIHTYNSILSLLHWDQETYMPTGAGAARSSQIAQLSTLLHEEKSSQRFKHCLEKLVHLKSGKPRIKGLSKQQLACLREWHKDFIKATKLPASFVKTFSQTTSEASQIWAIAKKTNQFRLFAPFLEKIIHLSREKAEI
ncbi:MAG: carboxypeptidase M32, partial [Chlamydiota bacterium]